MNENSFGNQPSFMLQLPKEGCAEQPYCFPRFLPVGCPCFLGKCRERVFSAGDFQADGRCSLSFEHFAREAYIRVYHLTLAAQ